jgi:hypothetical protein
MAGSRKALSDIRSYRYIDPHAPRQSFRSPSPTEILHLTSHLDIFAVRNAFRPGVSCCRLPFRRSGNFQRSNNSPMNVNTVFQTKKHSQGIIERLSPL